ncbi:ROK family protein [Spirosoma aerolatum]|uniref:ROK family protein n=1 Tax=Spirosoma aerolatum TaxID=1211326 RepID=UPI0009ABFC30|nr:ROK family protein [Spirosoma aerolatum]
MKTLAIGIDIGGTRTKIGLVNLDTGQVEAMIITPTETQDGDRFLALLGEAISQFKAKAAAEQAFLSGVGMGVPGFVFADGTVDSTYGFLEFMEDYPLRDKIQQQHDLPCLLDNDARVVALGEAIYGQGKGRSVGRIPGVPVSRVLVLTLGTGLGIGFTIDGKLDGSLPFAHMSGHMTITTNDFVCYCGKTGCLESLVSGAGLGRIATRQGWLQKYPTLPLTAQTIFTQNQAGNPDAEMIVQEYIGYLKIGIDNYINLYAPDVIVLGGGIAKGFGKNEIDKMHNPNLLNPYKAYKTRITISELEEQAGILGSAALFAVPS